ncbi:hypothetical protein [Desulfocurvus sp. DL9XJH121]
MTKWFIAMALPVLLLGCQSQLPVATTYPMTGQHKMQAAEHWNILAADVAGRVARAVHDRVELRLLAIDVDTDQVDGPFHQVFKELLRSQLVFQGLQVSDKEENQLELRYKVQMVRHGMRFQRPPPGLLTAIGAGIAVARDHLTVKSIYAAAPLGALVDVTIGSLSMHSNNEIVITTELVWRNRFVMHASDIYYINDPDYRQYGLPIPEVALQEPGVADAPEPLAEPARVSVGVVNE